MIGKNSLRLLKFAIKFQGEWHSYGTDRSTRDAINTLVSLELIECNQFR